MFDFQDHTDKLDLSAFGFKTAAQALSFFFEIGSTNDNKVGFEAHGTSIIILGLDLKDISASDLII